MAKKFVFVVAVLFCFGAIPFVTARSQQQLKASKRPYTEDQILLKFRDSLQPGQAEERDAAEILAIPGLRATSLGSQALRQAPLLISLDGKLSVEDAVERAAKDPRVEYAEPNYIYHLLETRPDDQYFSQQWALFAGGSCSGCTGDIDAMRAWDITTGSDDLVVAVIDTGIDLSHDDLAANAWINPHEIPQNGIDDDGNGYIDDINGWNFSADNNRLYDKFYVDFHGTHVAGSIGAVGNNQIGTTGVAWSVKLMSLKFIGNKNGEGTLANAVKAINYAIDQRQRGVNIRAINASWGGPGDSQALRKAIKQAGEAGILFVCAAGNESENVDEVPSYPVAYTPEIPSLISVGATWLYDTIAPFTNYGHRTVSICAPGFDILSTQAGGGVIRLDGTSMSTPHVTGIAVLLWAQQPSLTPAEVKQRIISTADPLETLASVVASSGRANAYRALTNTPAPPRSPVITDVQFTKKAITVDGLGFEYGAAVIEANGIALPGVQYDDSYRLANGTVTRLVAKIGKKAMRASFQKGVGVSFVVFNPGTGERSAGRWAWR